MRICVISGSPKGEESITLQYVRFMEKAFPDHTFSVVHAGREIHRIEQQNEAWDNLLAEVKESDGVLFATPVYYMLVPAQLKRFIELIHERDATGSFSGKYTAALTTSIHFYDHTAHAYLAGICEDLGMHYVGFYSAHMKDLHSEDSQKRLIVFFSDFLEAIAEQRPIQRQFVPVPILSPNYSPKDRPVAADTHGKRVVIIHDAEPGSDQETMVRQLAGGYAGPVMVAHIRDAMMKGGCLGCCRCAFDNTCVYHDGFRDFWDKYIVPADILIMAGTIRDRYLSATWKQFNDRSFFKGHIPTFEGKQVGYLVEGPLAHLPNLREVLTGRTMVGGGNLVGIVTNEGGDADEIDAALQALASRSVRLADQGYLSPITFPAIGGHKLFRDEIWGGMRAIFKADDRYYRSHGYYDFPTKNYLQRIGTRAFSLFLDIPGIRRNVEKNMTSHMVRSFHTTIEKSRILAERGVKQG